MYIAGNADKGLTVGQTTTQPPLPAGTTADDWEPENYRVIFGEGPTVGGDADGRQVDVPAHRYGAAMNSRMKRMSSVAAAATSIAAAALIGSASAHAEPVLMDPQVPNGTGLWCQGGMGNAMLVPFCKGAPFPDGSYWKQTGWIIPFQGLGWNPPVCVGPDDQPAAPGGCGGAA